MSKDDTALTFALLKVLSTRIGEAKKNADAEIRDGWKVKDRNAAVLPDGTKIGSVTLAKGKLTADIVNQDAFLEWVLATHPDAVEQVTVTRVNPDFAARMVAFARATGSTADPATGEEVPGLRVQEGDPYAMTILEEDAVEQVAKAWQDGELGELIGALVRPAIEQGPVDQS